MCDGHRLPQPEIPFMGQLLSDEFTGPINNCLEGHQRWALGQKGKQQPKATEGSTTQFLRSSRFMWTCGFPNKTLSCIWNSNDDGLQKQLL